MDPFLDKIKLIILDHLDDDKFGVNELASEIGLSKSQIFRKVKSLSNKSVNQFINETRLEEAAKLILNSNLTASEISYKVGFSSPSYFNKCFSKYFGVTPGEYKEKIEDNSLVKTFDQQASPSIIRKFQTFFYILGTILLIFGIISIIKSKSSTINTDPSEISIAVLYFDDHSPQSDLQWFCKGLTEEIIEKLSNIKSLQVTSRTSVKQFINTKTPIPAIAKTLEVDYILESSVSKSKNSDSVRIITQLINLKDKHVWSNTYDESIENSLRLQNDVSKHIVKQLNITLSPDEVKSIEKYPTENLEALQLFSEGLSYLDLVSVENLDVYRFILPGGIRNLIISDSLFQQALAIDPNYAEAMAQMAFIRQMYWEKSSRKWTKIKFKEIDSLINRSLEINPNLSIAYITKGLREGYNNGNWEKSGEYFKKALEIKPNDATNQLYYALYFALRSEPDYKKALEHINIAQKLNPHSATINYDKIIYLLKNDKIIEAEEFYNSNKAFFTEILNSKISIKLLIAKAKKKSIEKKDWREAIKFYQSEVEKDPNSAEKYRLLAEAYDEILYDAPTFLKYAKKAFYLDTVHYFYKRTIGFAYLKNKKFKEGMNFLDRYRKGEKAPLYNQYYYEGDYEKAQYYLDMYKSDPAYAQANLYAQQDSIIKTYEILNKGVLTNLEKARVFAILKERDSMYYYINKEQDIYNIRHFNSFFEVDPYRKDKRFKALLKKHYLPLTHWNE